MVEGERQVAEAGMLTRGQVARRLGVAVASVRRLEGTKLHPRREDGRWLFAPDEVERVAAERVAGSPDREPAGVRPGAGDLAAEVFALLDQRHSFSAIVRLTRQPPATIRKIYREWREGFGEPDSRSGRREEPASAELEAQRARDERDLRRWEAAMRQVDRNVDQHEDVDVPEGALNAHDDEEAA